jgi:uncharacterized membrane protein
MVSSPRSNRSSLAFRLLASAGIALGACAASAQPVLVINGLPDDLSASGNKTAGLFFDATLAEYVTYVWERGVGYTRIPGAGLSAEPIRGSSDLSVLATGKLNADNWADINCFNGYCAFGDCTPGEPLPPPSPCQIPTIAHTWSAGSGWVNAGSIDRTLDAATGRYFGGTRCDSSVNTANDLSGDGRYVVGGAWSSGLFNADGGPAFGVCGDFVGFIADRITGDVSSLPVQPGTKTSRADSISNDGTVITGYDQGEIIDPEFGPYEGRRICVWTNGVQTLIDALSSSFSTYPVNGAGTVIAGSPSPTFNQVNFGVNDLQLVRWLRQGDNTWVPQALGRLPDYFDGTDTKPLTAMFVSGISDDGGTIIGTASYGIDFFDRISRPFIWRSQINDGAPIDLATYVASIDPLSPIVEPGFSLTSARGISADGNALSVSVWDSRTTCDPQNLGLPAGNHGVLYLNAAGVPCDQPRIGLQPQGSVSTQYTPFGVAINVFASGTWPMTYQWQREDPQNPGQWLDLSEACSGFPFGGEWDYEGVSKSQLRVGQANCGNSRDGRYRVVISNSCGTVTSEPATVSFQQGTLITQQPVDATGCATRFASFVAVAISNSAELASSWDIADATDPENFTPLVDGTNVMADGRRIDVFGSDGQFLGLTPGTLATSSAYKLRCRFFSPCGDATSSVVNFTICRSDINCDGFTDFFDFNDFVDAFDSGQPIADFNGDGFADFFDFNDFVGAFEQGC